jgi:hypothetical protein
MFKRIYDNLIAAYVKRTGRKPEGIDLLKLKLQAQEEARQAAKVVEFKPRPDSPYGKPGGWMPTEEEAEGIMSRLSSDVKNIEKKSQELKEMGGKGKTKAGKINYEEMQKEFPNVKLFGDESFDELLEIEKTGVHPRNNKSRLLTDDEIEDYSELLGDTETWLSEGTVEEAEQALKRQREYENYMFGQYKAGRLDPKTGEVSKSRLNYLKNKLEEMEMSGDKKLITPDEIEELSDLEKRFEYLDLQQKAQNVDKKLSTEEINKLKELDDMGFADVLAEIDRNKKSKGGRIKLKKGGLSHILGV